MRPALEIVEDSGARITSSLVASRQTQLNAYITFIRCASSAIYVGLGNNSVQIFPIPEDSQDLQDLQEKSLSLIADSTLPLRGLPLCGLNAGNDGLLIGTDSGQLLQLTGQLTLLASVDKGWIEQLAIAVNQLRYAYSSGKDVYVRDREHQLIFSHSHDQGTLMGLAFNRAGNQLAVAHYNGVTLWDIASGEAVHQLYWPGAHLSLSWSKDNRFIITTTQDKELHGWDLDTISDGKPKSIRMCGYPAKIRKLSWTADGKHLAVAGADSVTVWSFADGDPSGKPPYEFGYVFQGIVTQVAAHPQQAIIAAGYNNGAILIGKYHSGSAIIARPPCGHFITALSWSIDGNYLYAGTDSGSFIAIHLLSMAI